MVDVVPVKVVLIWDESVDGSMVEVAWDALMVDDIPAGVVLVCDESVD